MVSARLPAFLTAVCGAVLLAGCSTYGLDPKNADSIRRIAVINLVPDQANIERMGLTVFQNDRRKYDLGRAVDDRVQATVAQRLSRTRPSWELRRIDYDRPALATAIDRKTFVWSYDVERIKPQLQQLAQRNRVDVLLVISPTKWDSHPETGIGVWMRTGFSESPPVHAIVHGYISVVLLGADGTVLAAANTGHQAHRLTKTIKTAEYGITYDLNQFPPPTPAGKLGQEILSVLERAVLTRLDDLRL